MSNLLDPIVETLREAEPRPEAVDRAVAALRRPHPPRLVPLAAGIAIVSGAMLWPHPGNGLAWAQVASQDLPLRYHERTEIVKDGKTIPQFERWVDRPNKAIRNYYRLSVAAGWEGRRSPAHTEEMEFIVGPSGWFTKMRGVATFSRKKRAYAPLDSLGSSSFAQRTKLEGFLKDKGLRQESVERGVQTRVGVADVYHLRIASKTRVTLSVFVLPGSKRVLGWDRRFAAETEQTTLDYPDRFPTETFAVVHKTDATTFDLDAIDVLARERLEKPVAMLEAGGQKAELRLVVQGARRELWTLWTGGKPNGDLAQKVQVLGIPNGIAYGLAGFAAKSNTGGPYGGHAVQLDRRVDRVDLRIPVFAPGSPRSRFAGYATVRNVAVEQVSGIDVVWSALGVKSPIR